jgi:hypothetical protein
VTWAIASVFASRSGMMQHIGEGAFPSALGNNGNGRRSRNWITRSEGADSSAVAAISACPNGSRLPQRWMLATASRASTGVPS